MLTIDITGPPTERVTFAASPPAEPAPTLRVLADAARADASPGSGSPRPGRATAALGADRLAAAPR
ncbi:hypothetical protein [Dactylosporangium sp. CA-139066]|uniref:hypothetical protein n=1 Tax=Dactylosporangium sp. CA-139066 TaxID=3239930 RepID=UPI003D8D7493